jgi:hypothetical protein
MAEMKIEFVLTSVLGQDVCSIPFQCRTGQNTCEMDLSGTPDGIYILHIKNNNSVITKKLIISKS